MKRLSGSSSSTYISFKSSTREAAKKEAKAHLWTHHTKASNLIFDDCYAPPVFLLEKSVQESGLAGAQEAGDDLQMAEGSRSSST